MTLKGMGYLRKKLANYKMGVDTRYNQYAMQHNDIDVGITIPPQIRQQYRAVLGWTAKGVDSLADRLVFREFANDEFGANEIFAQNNPDVFFDSAILSALIGSCCFVLFTFLKGTMMLLGCRLSRRVMQLVFWILSLAC